MKENLKPSHFSKFVSCVLYSTVPEFHELMETFELTNQQVFLTTSSLISMSVKEDEALVEKIRNLKNLLGDVKLGWLVKRLLEKKFLHCLLGMYHDSRVVKILEENDFPIPKNELFLLHFV